jgi:hypothetical protein
MKRDDKRNHYLFGKKEIIKKITWKFLTRTNQYVREEVKVLIIRSLLIVYCFLFYSLAGNITNIKSIQLKKISTPPLYDERYFVA